MFNEQLLMLERLRTTACRIFKQFISPILYLTLCKPSDSSLSNLTAYYCICIQACDRMSSDDIEQTINSCLI